VQELKLCIDCRHFDIKRADCLSPANLTLSLVDGRDVPLHTPGYLRDTFSKCGRSAQWFVPVLQVA
jgi:hypothetical protein